MPWKENTVVDQRVRFVRAYCTGAFEMSELCALYSISRPTGYLWTARYEQGGRAAMVNRSCAPHHCPHRMSASKQAWFIKARKRYGWGARKLLKIFRNHYPASAAPSRTAISDLLKRTGLSLRRSTRAARPASGTPRQPVSRPNQLWTIDFKGQFRTGDHAWCYPLTLADEASRYLLLCRGQRDCSAHPAQQRIDRVFREYGLPQAIHSDNGSPFASRAIAGLSQLSVQWVKLGIRIERSRPGCPQDNGAHERMHRTLKASTARPPARNLQAQQRRFNGFVHEYNQLRPHEALQDETPASVYRPSTRAYPSRIAQPDYPGHCEVRRVSFNGYVAWQAQKLFVSEALAHQQVAFEAVEDGIWSLHFYHQLLGRFDERTRKLIPL